MLIFKIEMLLSLNALITPFFCGRPHKCSSLLSKVKGSILFYLLSKGNIKCLISRWRWYVSMDYRWGLNLLMVIKYIAFICKQRTLRRLNVVNYDLKDATSSGFTDSPFGLVCLWSSSYPLLLLFLWLLQIGWLYTFYRHIFIFNFRIFRI